MRKRIALAAALSLLCLAPLAFGDSEHYEALTAEPTEYTNLSGDTLTVGTKPGTRVKPVRRNPTVCVDVDLSGSANDTVLVYCRLWLRTGSGWMHLTDFTATATAGAAADADGDQVSSNGLLFDTAGATHVEVLVASPSAGTADIRFWTYGANSQ